MSTLVSDHIVTKIQEVMITDDSITIYLTDGRVNKIPIIWYPRLSYANKEHRENWQISPSGWGIHWPDLDEDISLKSILEGNKSFETAASLKKWLHWYNNSN